MSSATPEFTASVSINVNQDKHTCSHCKRTFRSNRGLNQHLRSYASKNPTTDESGPKSERNKDTEASPNTTNTTLSSAP